MNRILTFLSFLLLSFTLSGCVEKYDSLVTADEMCEGKWADVEVQYQRRADLIPALIKTVKAGADSEAKILAAVTEARSTKVNLADPESLRAFTMAQDRAFNMVREAYPDLDSTEGFLVLQAQLEGTENRIARARQEYNDAVRQYNTELRKVGGVAVNSVTGQLFQKRAFFGADAAASNAPKVEF